MKRISILLSLLIFPCVLQAQLAKIVSDKYSDMHRMVTVSYVLPDDQSNWEGGYKTVSYEIAIESPTDNIESRLIIEDANGHSFTTTWNKGMNDFTFQLPQAPPHFNLADVHAMNVELRLDGYTALTAVQLFFAIDEWWLYGDKVTHAAAIAPVKSQILLEAEASSIDITNLKLNGEVVVAGDVSDPLPAISATIQDTSKAIKSWKIEVYSSPENQLIEGSQAQTVTPQSTEAISASYQIQSSLDDGRYYFQVSATNGSDEEKKVNSAIFEVSTKMKIKDALLGPNPFNPNQDTGTIQYQLTQPGDVVITVFSISGEHLKEWRFTQGETGAIAGINRVSWDGRNKYGEVLANGAYLMVIQAMGDSGEDHEKVKVLILK